MSRPFCESDIIDELRAQVQRLQRELDAARGVYGTALAKDTLDAALTRAEAAESSLARVEALLPQWREHAEALGVRGYFQQQDQVDSCVWDLETALGVPHSKEVKS